MCRKNQLSGFCLAAFGLGMLIGCGIESGFWCCVLGIGGIICGLIMVKKHG